MFQDLITLGLLEQGPVFDGEYHIADAKHKGNNTKVTFVRYLLPSKPEWPIGDGKVLPQYPRQDVLSDARFRWQRGGPETDFE